MPNRTSNLRSGVENLPPAYFAMVMATGIVSIASHLMGFSWVDTPFLWLNCILYFALWAMTIARLVIYPAKLLADLGDHLRGVGFFTMVAATCVLGSQFVLLKNAFKLASFLLGCGVVLWIFFIYSLFTAFTIRARKPPLEEGISGVWLVAAVATQSISILSSMVSIHHVGFQEMLLFASLFLFLLGGLFYFLIIILIFYRFMFFSMLPEALGPPYWINMGAVAISTLAGVTLIANSRSVTMLQQFVPFVSGATLLFWAVATWWIPLLMILEIWRSIIRRIGYKYEPQYWGMVFPLGMYTTCTFQLAKALHLDFLAGIPRYFIYIALCAWIITFTGWLKKIGRSFIFNPGSARLE